MVHRLIAESFLPLQEDKLEVNHINEVKTDNRLENLEWVSRDQNVQHSIGKIRKAREKQSPTRGQSKLYARAAHLRWRGESVRRISEILNVTTRSVTQVLNRASR